ncbi:MAG: hypothetical protein K9G58_12480 [Bacteroidales bacterium]|nr:hypothetical protein [Bacteroidales bacterium]MCF8386749.1 hypothetical protein [Bacteroidales bacterium]MCF8398982.1 hypothetical protein [Bacteroidales bacterium]
MKSIKTGVSWIDDLLPGGLPLHTATIITGPGGSGKPLIGENFVAAWLKSGGSVAFMSLQYPDKEFLIESIREVTDVDLNDFAEKIMFIQLDTDLSALKSMDDHTIRANLVKPDVWECVMIKIKDHLPDEGPGVLVFGSALNLLLFSPTYGEEILEAIRNTITSDIKMTYLFSVSTSAKAKEIAHLEEVADNLIMTRSTKKPFRLYLKVIRMKDVSFKTEEVQVKIDPGKLEHIKQVAEHSRSVVIPAISKI